MSTERRVCVLGRICVPFASRIISEETVKRASGDFQLRSDPLLLAQIAGGKHNGLRPISMSTAAWSGACISERSYANGESAATSELISSLRGAWCTRHGPFSLPSLPISLAFTCARALTPTRSRDGASGTSCNRREFGGPATRGQENPLAEKPPKKRPTGRYDLFVLIIIALIIARGAHSRPRYSRARTRTRILVRIHT